MLSRSVHEPVVQLEAAEADGATCKHGDISLPNPEWLSGRASRPCVGKTNSFRAELV